MDLVTRAECARRLKVSREYIGKMVKKGRIPLVGGKHIDMDTVKEHLGRTASSIGAVKEALNGKAKSSIDGKITLIDAQTALTTYKAKTAKLEYEQLEGRLMGREEAKRQAFDAGRRVRDALMVLPDQYADRLAVVSAPREMREVLRLMLRDVIGSIVDGR